jgi:transcriptional regulator with XRE-family HTH domain
VEKHPKRQYYKDQALLQQIGSKIREARQQREMSIELLANECGIDYSQVNRMELGKVNFSISYLYKIASVLKVDPKALLP